MSETKAVSGKNDEATETGIFFIDIYQHKATIDAIIPKKNPTVMFLKLNRLIAFLFVKKVNNKSIIPPKNCLPANIKLTSIFLFKSFFPNKCEI